MASFDIFLSHNSIDKTQVEWVAHKLKSAGLEPWLDKWHLVAGQVWQSDLAEILRTCPTCGIFVGRNGLGDWAARGIQAPGHFSSPNRIVNAVFSPDGRHVLTTSSGDNTVPLWEAESGKLLATFQAPSDVITSAAFSPDGRRVLTGSMDKTSRLWPLLAAGFPPPDWCVDFLLWLGGKRIAPDGQIETLPGDELGKLEARLRPHLNEDSEYARLLRWRLLSPQERPVDPYGTTTQPQAANLIIRPDMNQYESEHAYDLDPWHPLIHLALAGFEKDPLRADFLRHYSLDRLPNDSKLRQRAAELLRKQGKEGLALQLEGQGKQ